MNYRKFHKSFTLNSKSFENAEELLLFSKTISNDVFTFLDNWLNAIDTIAVQTSGSTGKPTTIQLKKEYMINSAIATGNYFEIHEKTKALVCLSPNYIAGKMMWIRALVLGWRLDVIKPDANPLKNNDTDYDFCAMVPLQLSNSLSHLHRIKKLIIGGGVVSNKLINELQDVSTKVYATYGMTETITHIAIKSLNNLNKTSLREAPIAIGITQQSLNYETLPNIKISTDNRNCLVIDAPKISDKTVVTNDIVELVSKTEFKWLGRYDTIINSGGVKLIPEQIEEKLSTAISNRFFIASIPDDMLGEKLILVIEGKNLTSEFQFPTSLHKYEIPKQTFYIEKFIETGTKKVNRANTLALFLK